MLINIDPLFFFLSHSVVSDSLWPHGLYSPWNSPGQDTGVGSLSLLQGVFPTQGSNWGVLHCKQILYQLSYQESPHYWVNINHYDNISFTSRNYRNWIKEYSCLFLRWKYEKLGMQSLTAFLFPLSHIGSVLLIIKNCLLYIIIIY